MFEYNLSYYKTRFHKPGDEPFTFPPEGTPPKIDANIIEIEGRNGSGKTTFLNCVALAMGYLDEKKQLKQKRHLVQRLQSLESNQSLAFDFKIEGPLPEMPTLKASQKAGQSVEFEINSVPTDLIELKRQFEVIYLADDDPQKDVKNTLNSISDYLKDYEEQLNTLTSTIGMNLIKIRNYNQFKAKEKKYLDEIDSEIEKIDFLRKQIEEKKKTIELVKKRDTTKKKMSLLNDRERITNRFEELERLYKELESSEQPELMHKIGLLKMRLLKCKQEEDTYENRFNIYLRKLRQNGVELNKEKLLSGDTAEFEEVLGKYEESPEDEDQRQMIEELISVFHKYSGEEIVPYFEKPIEEILEGLSQEQSKRAQITNKNRIYNLLMSTLDSLKLLGSNEIEIEKLQDKITELSAKIKNLERFDEVQKELQDLRIQYVELQDALQDVAKLTREWKTLSLILGEAEVLEVELQTLEISKKTEETLRGRAEQNLAFHREHVCEEPKNYNKEAQLEQLSEEVLSLRTKLTQWISILQRNYSELDEKKPNPKTRDKFPDEDVFIKAVGDFIGASFEPVDYVNQMWDIKSYNLKTQAFITKDDREIELEELSRGQTRKLTLVKILKEMKPDGKKKILLVDEIGDLDVYNLTWIRETMNSKFAEGILILAIMVRPMTEKLETMVEIRRIG